MENSQENRIRPQEETEFRCVFCGVPADRIAFYSKFYPFTNMDTIEQPVLSCPNCYLSAQMMKKIGQIRGGAEGIACLRFADIGAMNKQRIGYYLSNKYWEKNDFSNAFWRKILYRIHYTHLLQEAHDPIQVHADHD